MTTRGVYVLESRWSWDNQNTEYATLTIEEPYQGLEILGDPEAGPERTEALISMLRRVGEAQRGGPYAQMEMVRLYRVAGLGDSKWVQRIEEQDTGVVNLSMRMEPICDFDENGNPVPILKEKLEVELGMLLKKNAQGISLTEEEFRRAHKLILGANPTEELCWMCKLNNRDMSDEARAIYDIGLCRGHAQYALFARK